MKNYIKDIIIFLVGAATATLFMIKILAGYEQEYLVENIYANATYLTLMEESDFKITEKILKENLNLAASLLEHRLNNELFYFGCTDKTKKILKSAQKYINNKSTLKCD